MSGAIERGAAEVVITLEDGTITIKHGEDGTILGELHDAPDGTWSRLWDAMEALGIQRRVRG